MLQRLALGVRWACSTLGVQRWCGVTLVTMVQVSFTQFKRKLALVPVIFFLLRLPGNVLTVWLYLEPTADTESACPCSCPCS